MATAEFETEGGMKMYHIERLEQLAEVFEHMAIVSENNAMAKTQRDIAISKARASTWRDAARTVRDTELHIKVPA